MRPGAVDAPASYRSMGSCALPWFFAARKKRRGDRRCDISSCLAFLDSPIPEEVSKLVSYEYARMCDEYFEALMSKWY